MDHLEKINKKIVPNVIKLINHWNNNDIICYTYDTHYEKTVDDKINYDSTLEGQTYPMYHCIENTPGWHLNEYVFDALSNFEGPLYKFTKNTYTSWEMVNNISKIDEINEIFIAGLFTDISVLSTAILLRAKLPNIRIFVHSDCCVGSSTVSHLNALHIMKNNGITII